MTLKKRILSIVFIILTLFCLVGCSVDIDSLLNGGQDDTTDNSTSDDKNNNADDDNTADDGTDDSDDDSNDAGNGCQHEWQAADCTTPKTCSLCHATEGKAKGHTAPADDGDCTTAELCVDCNFVLTAATLSHVGGTPTCTELAKCSVCGMSYGETAAHSSDVIWIKRLDGHFKAYSCCYERVGETEAHKKDAFGVCTICGFKPSVTIEDCEVNAGDTITIAISVSDNPGILGLALELIYNDEFLTLTDAKASDALSSLTFSKSDTLESGMRFLFDGESIDDADIKDGEFLVLLFEIDENAPQGEYIILTNVISAYDNDLKSIDFAILGGKITVNND